MMQTKYIFVIGGVLSGLGKGITTASIGLLLKSRGFKVTAVKIDPYVSIDAGTMRPAEHGEVFVTDDGGEIDQDIGHYERFMNISLTKYHNITTGKVFRNVIQKERSFFYQGRDAEMFPDVINEVQELIFNVTKGVNVALVEVGGTTGDLENRIFLHAAREIGRNYKSIYIMVGYVPLLKSVGELKTKPIQHAVTRLREFGIIPDLIVTRNEIPLDKPRIETISKRCFIDEDCIIDNPDVDDIYKVPLVLEKNRITEKILKKLELEVKKHDSSWEKLIKKMKKMKGEVRIGLVGKYVMHGSTKHKDVYISVHEAVKHASIKNNVKTEIIPIDSSEVEKNGTKILENLDGIIVPQGWGSRGTEGKIEAARFARENKISYLGLCFGMQMATIEFARNVCSMKNANSTEINPKTSYPVIHIMPDQKEYLAKKQYGGTIRLGAWPCKLKEDSVIKDCYIKNGWEITKGVVQERHRHRYEFNNEYRKDMESKGLIISGISPDGKLVEAIELPRSMHPFFVGTQFHPEYKSRPLNPHPIFVEFIKACKKSNKNM